MTRLEDIEFRTLDYGNDAELRSYFRQFWEIPIEQNEYFYPRSDSFLSEWVEKECSAEYASITYAGIALHGGEMVGLHIVRQFEEWEQMGAHIAGLWVRPDYRGMGIARELKRRGEAWAKSAGATFMNTYVHAGNERMLEVNRNAGYSTFRLNLRKRL